MVKHIWIITGGRVDTAWLRSIWPFCFQKDEENVVIAADKGLLYAKEAGIPVNKILGDFDSLPQGILEPYETQKGKKNQPDIEIRTYPPEKDYTDTHLALLWAIEEKADKVTIFGGLGSRFDHSFANIGLLSLLLSHGIQGEIVDEHNRIFMMDQEHTGNCRIIKRNDRKEYISLIPYTEEVTGVTLSGFKYPLTDETLTIGISRGISNELLEEEGEIKISQGILMVIHAID